MEGTIIQVSDPDATGRLTRDMQLGHHYNYQEQKWHTGNDHVHLVTVDGDVVALYCGADYETCTGKVSE